jgi:hypothetical protein
VYRRRQNEILTDEEEREFKSKLKLNSNYFHNNFVKAHWIPNEFLTDLRNWHSPMIREWTYHGHTRVGQPVGLTECLPRRYNFMDIMRTSKNASSLPPSFHRMPDLSSEEMTRHKNHANKELHDLIQYTEQKLHIKKQPEPTVKAEVKEMVLASNSPMKRLFKQRSMKLKRTTLNTLS